MEFIVYAAGPIAGCTYEGCTTWREDLQNKFNALVKTGDRIRVASPMRAKEYLKDTVVTNEVIRSLKETYHIATGSSRAIMTRDYFDCTRADLCFVNFMGATQISIGTVMEVAFRFHGRPTIIVMDEKNVHQHPMLTEAGLVIPDFDVAVKVAANMLLPNISGTSEDDRKYFTLDFPSPIQGTQVPSSEVM